MLVVFGGKPGSGKTTLARLAAEALAAAYLRIDAIEAALGRAGISRDEPVGLAAYVVANAVADGSLRAGATVVVDAVNPVEEARAGWRLLARETGVPLRVVEVVCGDEEERRRRVESRTSDLEGHSVPTWAEAEAQPYERWTAERLVVDTAAEPPAACLERVLAYVRGG